MVVRIISVKKDGTTTVQYHDPATNTYTKTHSYSSTKDAFKDSFYHAFDNTPAFYSPVKGKVDKSWVNHSSHHSSHSHHSSSSHSSHSTNNSSPVFYYTVPHETPHPSKPIQPSQQQPEPTTQKPQQPEVQEVKHTNSKYLIGVGILALVLIAIYLKRRYYGTN